MPPASGAVVGVAPASGKSHLLGTYDGVSALQLKFPAIHDKCGGGKYVLSEYQPGTTLAVESRGSNRCIEVTRGK